MRPEYLREKGLGGGKEKRRWMEMSPRPPSIFEIRLAYAEIRAYAGWKELWVSITPDPEDFDDWFHFVIGEDIDEKMAEQVLEDPTAFVVVGQYGAWAEIRPAE